MVLDFSLNLNFYIIYINLKEKKIKQNNLTNKQIKDYYYWRRYIWWIIFNKQNKTLNKKKRTMFVCLYGISKIQIKLNNKNNIIQKKKKRSWVYKYIIKKLIIINHKGKKKKKGLFNKKKKKIK